MRVCGNCSLAASVRAGTIYKRQIYGVVVDFTQDEALAELAARCRCSTPAAVESTEEGRVVVDELGEPGKWKTRPGQLCSVQLKRAPYTRRSDGHVTRCFSNGEVEIALGSTRLVIVPIDEWFHRRNGQTKT